MADKGKKVDLDKLRSIGNLRSGYKDSKQVEKRSDGKQVHHWDGRLDAHVTPRPVRVGKKGEG